MSTRVVERVDEWEQEPFEGGYRGLGDLADREFSGVVRAGGAELFMTKGIVVGVRRGSIEEFEGATGTTYVAPEPALPLLAVMQDRSEEVRAKYYTEETPISEVDQTLEDGKFTGYVELSENVLSGDYYLVYHQGRSMSVAFVGNSGQLLGDEEAFDRADGEVGIYEVRPVEIEPIEIPEPTESGATSAASEVTEETDETPEEPTEASGPGSEGESADGAETDTQRGASDPEPAEADRADGIEEEAGPEPTADAGPEPPTDTEPAGTEAESAEPDRSTPGGSTHARAREAESTAERSTAEQSTAEPDHDGESEQTGREGGEATTDTHPGAGASAAGGDPLSLETRTIPSLDPGRTSTTAMSGDAPGVAGEERSAGRTQPPATEASSHRDDAEGARRRERAESPASEPRAQTAGGEPADRDGTEPDPRTESLEAEIDRREAEIEELEAELEDAQTERDQVRTELEEIREERDKLRTEADRLRGQLEDLEEQLGAATDADRRLGASEALDGTDLFLRYGSKGDGTLEKAHGGSVNREDVRENLRLEEHTQFDAGGAAVNGRSYGEFLEERVEYTFVRWVVRELLFEIQNTGHTESLKELYDAIPEINRVELNGTVTVETEDGETTDSFDVIFRERMGDPLIVANINDSRQGASQAMMEELITAAERVGEGTERFAAAFLVTRSFFEPEALETVAEATRSGLLSRDKRASFVNLSRKRGYHLCLVEARNENFHLEVPEL